MAVTAKSWLLMALLGSFFHMWICLYSREYEMSAVFACVYCIANAMREKA